MTVVKADAYGTGVEAGLLKTIETPGGRKVTFTYGASSPTSLLTGIQDWGGRQWSLQYDASRQLTTLTSPLGCATKYHYDGSGRVDAIEFMLADMAIEIDGARLLAWEAAWKLDNNKEDSCVSAYLAQTGAADMAMMVTDRAVQILGGHGYIRENPVELLMRNGRGIPMLLGLAIV